MAKKQKKPKSKQRKILEWVATGVFLALIGTVAGFRIYQAASGDHAIFGTQFPVVLTDSMETDYMVGDVLKVKAVSPQEVKEAFDKGETIDISFKWNIGTASKPNIQMMTHRIIDVMYFVNTEDNYSSNYKYNANTYSFNNDQYHYTFVTHGINKHSSQTKEGEDLTNQLQFSNESQFVGRVTGKSQFLRVANQIFTSVWTLILLILIPGLYIVITSVIDLFKAFDDDEDTEKLVLEGGGTTPPVDEKKEDPLKGLSEEDKERLKKEMLEELLKRGKK